MTPVVDQAVHAPGLSDGPSPGGEWTGDPHATGQSRLRSIALLVLTAAGVMAAVQLFYTRSPYMGPVLLLQGFHATIASVVLLLTFTAFGARYADSLGIVFVLGLAANVYSYLHFTPTLLTTYPALGADALCFLLLIAAVFFAWSPQRMLIVCAVVWGGFAITAAKLSVSRFIDTRFALALGSLALGGAIAVASARVLGRFRASLAGREAELRALSSRVMRVQEEERRRLSRELHDGLGQSLTAVSTYLWLVERQLPSQLPVREHTAEARRLVARTLSEMRELSQLLCPPVLTLYGLVPSLDAYVKAFVERHQIAARFSAEGVAERFPAEMETALYRITQEALTNVVRHAQAHDVRVSLRAERDTIRLQVQDDGIGIRASRSPNQQPGTGIIGMTERVRALGGTLRIDSRRGTRLQVTLPYPPDARSECADHPLHAIWPDETGAAKDAAAQSAATPTGERLDRIEATGGL
jgi:signal transduction histidine kinase